MAEQPEAGDLDLDDLDWAKPLLDEAREDVARGRTVTLEEFNSQIDKIRAELRK
jgi:hypothetical protein